MNKIIIKYLIFIFLSAANYACSKNGSSPASETNNPDLLTGFNQNWAFLPPLNNTVFINNIIQLKPRLIRYPGGTVTHSWNWRNGTYNPPRANDFVHPIGDIKTLVDVTNVKIVFDLDVVNSSLTDQITMLDSVQKLGVPVEYIELGNELYANNHGYEVQFPDGNAYADTVNNWVPVLRAKYPTAKIAALHIGKLTNNTRQLNWNQQVTSSINDIDAFTYHIYIDSAENFEQRKSRFLSAYYNPGNKPIWITEYGNLNPYTQPDYLQELTKLADYVESFPLVRIALNHALVSTTTDRSKLEKATLGNTFTAEGLMFTSRVQ
ncbi:MAG: glycosyl hydrolase 53 family protein [Bacteroidetes bacterium]|nr:glycosyl hydrolase 53 family protein [Bacteroidota bacterium]